MLYDVDHEDAVEGVGAERDASSIGPEIALSRSGRLSVRVAIAPFFSYSRSLMGSTSLTGGFGRRGLGLPGRAADWADDLGENPEVGLFGPLILGWGQGGYFP